MRFKELAKVIPEMRIFGANVGDFNFVIAHDQMHEFWTASYRRKPFDHQTMPIGDDYSRDRRMPTFDSQNAAELACIRAYQRLRSPH